MIIYFLLVFAVPIFCANFDLISQNNTGFEIDQDIITTVPNEIIDKIFQHCDEQTIKNLKFVSKQFYAIAKDRYSLPYWKGKDSILLKENPYPIEVKKTFSTEFQIKYFLIDYYNAMAKIEDCLDETNENRKDEFLAIYENADRNFFIQENNYEIPRFLPEILPDYLQRQKRAAPKKLPLHKN